MTSHPCVKLNLLQFLFTEWLSHGSFEICERVLCVLHIFIFSFCALLSGQKSGFLRNICVNGLY